MKQTLTPQQWVDKNVKIDELYLDAVKNMAEAVNNDNLEDDTFVAHVYDIVGSRYGYYIPFYALQFFEYEIEPQSEDNNYEDAIWEIERFESEVANILNKMLPNEISVGFGNWDADGAYCLMAFLDKNEYESMKHESHNFIDELVKNGLWEVE